MNIDDLIERLREKDLQFDRSGKNPHRAHIRYKGANKVFVLFKSKPSEGALCNVAFGHLYEDTKYNKLFWLEKANESGSITGHNCIKEIYDSLGLEVQIPNEGNSKGNGKEITENDLDDIINTLINIPKENIALEDTEARNRK